MPCSWTFPAAGVAAAQAQAHLAATVGIFVISGLLLQRGETLAAVRCTTALAYGALLRSLWDLLRRYAVLRQAALAQGLLSMGFSAFWSTLAVMLHGAPFHLGSAVAGSFGLAGAVGALAAPIAGRLADRRGPQRVSLYSTSLTAASFALMCLATQLSPAVQLFVLIVCTVTFDLGVQSTLIAHQTLVYGVDANARSRLNAVLFVGMFTGMASGAALGSVLLAHAGWVAVTALATATSVAAFGVRLWRPRAA